VKGRSLLLALALLGCRPEPSAGAPEAASKTDDRPCKSAADCGEGQRCRSPEAASWNFCGPPREPNCPEGQLGDSCGNCFLACSEQVACPEGMTCNGSYCESALRCFADVDPPP
jgi:hypothetical protein